MRGLKDKITSSFIFAYVAAAVILGIGIEIIAENFINAKEAK